MEIENQGVLCAVRQWAEAYETSVRGLEWSVRRRASGCETLTHFALSLRLCAARCLRRLKRLDEAEYAFKVLAGAQLSFVSCHGIMFNV